MLEVVSDYQALVRMEPSWNTLADLSDNPFLRHECAVACAEVYGRSARLMVFVVRSGREIQAIAPFRVIQRAGVERLEMLTRPLWEPSGFLFADEAALDRLVDGLLDGRWPLVLGRLPAEGLELRSLRRKLAAGRVLAVSSQDSRSVGLPLQRDRRGIDAGLSSSRRATLRRMVRAAERRGTVEYGAVAPDEASLEPLLREAYRVEAANWKGRNGTAILMKPVFEDFFTRYCRALARLGMLRLFWLRIGGESAAVRIAVEHAQRLSDLKIGYDERYHDSSPGILLTHWTLQHCCERGLAGFHFMGDAEPWEDIWATEQWAYTMLTVHPRSIGGALSLSQDAAWRFTKRTLGALKLDKESRKDRARRARFQDGQPPVS